jgi:hypothetical protein
MFKAEVDKSIRIANIAKELEVNASKIKKTSSDKKTDELSKEKNTLLNKLEEVNMDTSEVVMSLEDLYPDLAKWRDSAYKIGKSAVKYNENLTPMLNDTLRRFLKSNEISVELSNDIELDTDITEKFNEGVEDAQEYNRTANTIDTEAFHQAVASAKKEALPAEEQDDFKITRSKYGMTIENIIVPDSDKLDIPFTTPIADIKDMVREFLGADTGYDYAKQSNLKELKEVAKPLGYTVELVSDQYVVYKDGKEVYSDKHADLAHDFLTIPEVKEPKPTPNVINGTSSSLATMISIDLGHEKGLTRSAFSGSITNKLKTQLKNENYKAVIETVDFIEAVSDWAKETQGIKKNLFSKGSSIWSMRRKAKEALDTPEIKEVLKDPIPTTSNYNFSEFDEINNSKEFGEKLEALEEQLDTDGVIEEHELELNKLLSKQAELMRKERQ